MASMYGPLRYEPDGARLGCGKRSAGEPVFDREGLRREGGGEEIRWGVIERIDVEIRDIGLKSWAQNALMFLLTVGSVTQRAPGTEDSYLWVKPVDGPPVNWGFAVPPRSEARWSPGAVRRFVRRLDRTGRRAHLGSPELAGSLAALRRIPRFPPWTRDRAVDRIVDALPGTDRVRDQP
ncbi:hypothetical protein [Kitasatospora purpeofusca]|uniref:hypothetical protein n=1 Tax=Kitasatospora purpeofusca TaxID=67352 RepID=UPI002A5A9406|nr:hypothetical protein [Kitasatospora purpeofusca]MDY0816800.1 hypothetical protein [Kitasatospora purpeofusca]